MLAFLAARHRVRTGGHGAPGDEAYAQGRYGEALAMYSSLEADGLASRASWPRRCRSASRRRAGRRRRTCTCRLAGEDPTRGRGGGGGARGVVSAAERSGAAAALQEAVLGLQTIAPGRRSRSLRAGPGAAARGRAGRAASRCCPERSRPRTIRHGRLAAAALRAGAGGDDGMRPGAAAVSRGGPEGTGLHASSAGAPSRQIARSPRAEGAEAGRQDDAVLWFAEASRVDSSSVTGRRALVSLGDLRLFQGDTLGRGDRISDGGIGVRARSATRSAMSPGSGSPGSGWNPMRATAPARTGNDGSLGVGSAVHMLLVAGALVACGGGSRSSTRNTPSPETAQGASAEEVDALWKAAMEKVHRGKWERGAEAARSSPAGIRAGRPTRQSSSLLPGRGALRAGRTPRGRARVPPRLRRYAERSARARGAAPGRRRVRRSLAAPRARSLVRTDRARDLPGAAQPLSRTAAGGKAGAGADRRAAGALRVQGSTGPHSTTTGSRHTIRRSSTCKDLVATYPRRRSRRRRW